MARGGKRQGRPGVGYSNRTDLMAPGGRMPNVPGPASPASGAQSAPPASPRGGTEVPAWISPDQTPRLNDPSGRPAEPLTTGLMSGPGRGPEALGPTPPSPVLASLEASYAAMPTPQLRRVIARFRAQGVL
jgi:hypothetical protein